MKGKLIMYNICVYANMHVGIYEHTSGSLAQWVECLQMVCETWVQSQFMSYQRL